MHLRFPFIRVHLGEERPPGNNIERDQTSLEQNHHCAPSAASTKGTNGGIEN